MGCVRGGEPHAVRLQGTTLAGDTLPIQPEAVRTAVIFYNGYSCRDCFPRLERALRSLCGVDSIARLVVLIRVGAGAVAQRSALKDVAVLLPTRSAAMFDIAPGGHDPWPPVNLEGGLFGRFGVSKTPALLVLDADGKPAAFLAYDSLGLAEGESSSQTRDSSIIAPRLRRFSGATKISGP